MYKYSRSSKRKLSTCHPDLQRIFNEVIKYMDVTIVYGYRGKDIQNRLYNSGFSKLKFPESKHNKTPSLAVDVAPWPTLWTDEKLFYQLYGIVKVISEMLDIKIRWGGHWKSFPDLAHFELEEA